MKKNKVLANIFIAVLFNIFIAGLFLAGLVLFLLLSPACIKDRRPSAPNNLVAMFSERTNAVNLHWNDNSFNEDYFKIMKNGIADTTITVNFFADINIEKNETYQYQVWAVNEYGAMESNIAEITIPGPPETVRNFIAIPAFHKIKLSWDDMDAVETYILVRDGKQIAELDRNTTIYLDTTVDIATEYVYILYAENEFGLSDGTLEVAKTLGKWEAVWDRSIDYIEDYSMSANSEGRKLKENGYAIGYNLYLVKDGLPSLLYTGPDTSFIFIRDFYPCAMADAFDANDNVSVMSEVACAEH